MNKLILAVVLLSTLASVSRAHSFVLGLNGEPKMNLNGEWSEFSQNGVVCKARVIDDREGAILQCYQPENPTHVFGVMAQCADIMGRVGSLAITAKDKNVDVLYVKCPGNQ